MAVDSRAFVQLQIEALSVRYFIVKYDEFESLVKKIFSSNTERISNENKQLLYFFLAGIKSSPHIEYNTNALKTDDAKYTVTETFSQFSLSQIVKIQRKNQLLDIFEFTIPSLNRKNSEYTFIDCCIKLLNMRNKLAHEMGHLSFTDKDIIELLSNDYIKNDSSRWYGSLDTELMSDESKSIFSNLILMEKMIELLKKQGVSNEH